MAKRQKLPCCVCSRHHHATKLPFFCPVDARNVCYQLRLDITNVLLENDQLSQQISTISSNPKGFTALDRLRCDTSITHTKVQDTRVASEALRRQIAAQREHMAVRRAVLDRRQEDLRSAREGLPKRRARTMEETEKQVKETHMSYRRITREMQRTRSFLCLETARLFGPITQNKSDGRRIAYEVGGVEIIDLMHLTTHSPEHISTSLGNIAHLLGRIAHYLHVRLPAELTLPHKDYPRPTIFMLDGSYQKSQPSLSSFSPDSSATLDPTNIYRARPLYISKPLAVLAKEDYPGYTAFIDAVALLCYDISWLCLTQGVQLPDRVTLDDVTALGPILYTLLYDELPPQPPSGTGSSRLTKGYPAPNPEPISRRFSHGAATMFPTASRGADANKLLRFPPPNTISEKLRIKLVTDLAMPEWEVLDTREYQMEEVQDADAVLITEAPDGNKAGGTASTEEKRSEKEKKGWGITGGGIYETPWMKVRSLAKRR